MILQNFSEMWGDTFSQACRISIDADHLCTLYMLFNYSGYEAVLYLFRRMLLSTTSSIPSKSDLLNAW